MLVAHVNPVNGARCEYYWNGTNAPVNLHIRIRSSNECYHTKDITLAIIDYRVYAFTREWSVMLYDDLIPGDEANILTRLRPYCNYNLIVKYIGRIHPRVYLNSNGAHVRYKFYGCSDEPDCEALTTIHGDIIMTQYSDLCYDPIFDDYLIYMYADAITYDMWSVFIRVDTGYTWMVIENKNRTIQTKAQTSYEWWVIGVIDGLIIIKIRDGIDQFMYTAISAIDPTMKRVIFTATNMQRDRIEGYFLYVLCSPSTMHMIDIRNGYIYEFTHDL